MTRYFFDLHECGDILSDNEGVEAADLETVRAMAVTAARDVMCGEVGRGELCLSCFIEIRDERKVLERLLFKDAVNVTGI